MLNQDMASEEIKTKLVLPGTKRKKTFFCKCLKQGVMKAILRTQGNNTYSI
jgi:hypothetical protein